MAQSSSAILAITAGLLLTGSEGYNNTVGLFLTVTGSECYDNTIGLFLTGSDGYDNTASLLLIDGAVRILLFYNLF